jgi:hypothetical protein
MTREPFEWRERGMLLVVDTMLGGGWRVEVAHDPGAWAAIELPPRAFAELATWLDGQLDEPLRAVADELEQQLRVAENERDEARARADRAEAVLAELVAEHRELAAAALRGGAR